MTSLFADPDFRKINWGMPKDEVKKIETAKLQKESDKQLIYSTEVAGFKTTLIYLFYGDKLTRAAYIFMAEHSNNSLFIDDFKKTDDLLTKKYGTPTQKKLDWRNELYKDSPSDWGTAVAAGQLVYYSYWGGKKTYIEHDLDGDNFEISHRLLYISQDLKDYEQKMKEKASTDNL